MVYKICIYPEWWESIDKLSLEDKGKILENIFYYSTKGEILHNSYIEVIFNFMKNRIDKDKETYEKKCETNREIGKLGGRPTKKEKQQKPTITQTVILDDKNNPQKPNSNSKYNIEDNILILSKDNSFTEEKKEYGNLEINKLLEVIKKYNNGLVAGTEKEKRQYGFLLLGKLKKIPFVQGGQHTPEEFLEIIISGVEKNQYHSHKIVGPKKIYYELESIIQVCKQEFTKEQENKMPFIPSI